MRRRRRNPMPSTGALLINPRRRKATRKRKAAPKRRRAAAKRKAAPKRSGAAKRSATARKAAATRRRNANKRSLAARKAAVTRRRNGRKANPRRRTAVARTRRAPARRRRAPVRRRRAAARRRNPSMASITAPIQKMVKKLPIVGNFLATVVGFAGPAALGAASVYPTLQALKYAGHYIPEKAQPFSFSIAGTVLAAIVLKLPVGSLALRKNLATAMAAGGGAVDFYRMGMGQSMVSEMEIAETAGLGYAGGMATGVVPYSGNSGYGALQVMAGAHSMGALEINGDYQGAGYGDAHFSGGDFSGDEIACALAGPRHWRQRFGRPAKSIYRRGGGLKNRAQSGQAGQHGHRWGWLIKLVGFNGAQSIAAMQPAQRRQAIASLRQQAIASLPGLLNDYATSDSQVTSDEAAGMGALITMAGW